MAPASSGRSSIISDSFGEEEEDRRGRESGGKRISRHHHLLLPLASTSSAADDAAAASALSAAVLPLLPPTSAAWAYGSGVFSQQRDSRLTESNSNSSPRPSVDLLLAVADTKRWHEDNLNRNPGHYSSVAKGILGGPRGISWLAEEVGPGVWFNSGVRVKKEGEGEGGSGGGGEETTLKYGVFSERALLSDLEGWGELYLAGRLQKPTLPLLLRSSATGTDFASRLEAALERNAAAALAAALLLLPPTFSHSRLLSTLVSLSYSGDVRVAAAAEDPLKVEKIVRGTGSRRLDGLYSRHLGLSPPLFSPLSPSSSSSSSVVASAAGLVSLCGGNAWAQDPRWSSRWELVGLLPEAVRRKVNVEAFPCFSGPFYSASSSSSPSSLLASSVRAALASTVRSSSARAALVGLVSAGPLGAASYALAKLRKGGWGLGGKS